MKIAVGMIMQETNSLSTIKTDVDDFVYSPLVPLLEGQELLEEHQGKETEVGGFLAACEEENVDVVPIIATYAVPSGNVTQEAFRWLKHLLLDRLRQVDDLDGVLLALHGSMVVDGLDDPDGEILAEVRKLVGDEAYVGCSLDLHANVTRQMTANADILMGYETHVDYGIIGRRTAQRLIRCMREGIRPHRCLKKIPMIFGAHEYVLQQKREMEQTSGVLSISLFDDNPWTDVEEYGPSVVVITEDNTGLGETLCEELAEAMWAVRHRGGDDRVSISEAVKKVCACEGGPTVLVETGDLTGGGGAGDCVAVLDALLSSGLTNVATVIYDPEAVSQAFEAGLGADIVLDIGGKHEYEGACPLRFRGAVRSLYEGRYTLKGVPYEGVTAFLGKTAVVGSGDTDVVLTSRRIYPQGAAIFDALNLDVSGKKVITLKGYSAGSSGPAFAFPVKEVISVETPGWTIWDFKSVPYKKIKRPIYPLDPM